VQLAHLEPVGEHPIGFLRNFAASNNNQKLIAHYEKTIHHIDIHRRNPWHDGSGMPGELWRRHAAGILLGLF
jgi:hypothetical protein